MNGGGGHEESVTWVLAEAERGMLVHCCCFVVNLVRGDTAARLLDALHALCQVTPSAVWETYSGRFYAFRSTDTRVHRGEVVFLFFFFPFFFFFLIMSGRCFDIPAEIVLLCWTFVAVTLPERADQLRVGFMFRSEFGSAGVCERCCWLCRIVSVAWTRVVLE